MKKKNQFWVDYVTGSGLNKYPIEIRIRKVSFQAISYEPEKVRDLCRQGCKNYNFAGGCPPFAPFFAQIAEQYQTFFLATGTFWPQYKTEKVRESPRMYVHFRLQDHILSRLLHHIGLQVREKTGGLFLGSGFCMGCTGKKCNFKNGLNYCVNPDKRTFSMEATGINVCKTVHENMGINFYWYKKGEKLDIPLTKCCLFAFNTNITDDEFCSLFLKLNKSQASSLGSKHLIGLID